MWSYSSSKTELFEFYENKQRLWKLDKSSIPEEFIMSFYFCCKILTTRTKIWDVIK